LIDTKSPGPKVVNPTKPSVNNGSAPKEDNTFNGTRKLIRPHLSLGMRRRDPVHVEDPLTHANIEGVTPPESSHAEAFYFQKQMQQQTEMTVILDDGEELTGVIQWYDKTTLKLLVGRTRVLIFKACIKYLFKTSEMRPAASVMK
jgi:sRNA-binding regulator protein Hfq